MDQGMLYHEIVNEGLMDFEKLDKKADVFCKCSHILGGKLFCHISGWHVSVRNENDWAWWDSDTELWIANELKLGSYIHVNCLCNFETH